MARRVRLDPLAKQELDEAIAYYEEASPGLGLRLWTRVDEVIDRMMHAGILTSTRVPKLPDDLPVFRIFVDPFPQQVVFVRKADDDLRIIAIAHMSREPRYWLDRLE
jgi:plasmid stabilization system protein ParE